MDASGFIGRKVLVKEPPVEYRKTKMYEHCVIYNQGSFVKFPQVGDIMCLVDPYDQTRRQILAFVKITSVSPKQVTCVGMKGNFIFEIIHHPEIADEGRMKIPASTDFYATFKPIEESEETFELKKNRNGMWRFRSLYVLMEIRQKAGIMAKVTPESLETFKKFLQTDEIKD